MKEAEKELIDILKENSVPKEVLDLIRKEYVIKHISYDFKCEIIQGDNLLFSRKGNFRNEETAFDALRMELRTRGVPTVYENLINAMPVRFYFHHAPIRAISKIENTDNILLRITKLSSGERTETDIL